MKSDFKVICVGCNWRGLQSELLEGLSPFDGSTISGCPHCKGIDMTVVACDEPECWNAGSMGTPTPSGYRYTCWEHRPFK